MPNNNKDIKKLRLLIRESLSLNEDRRNTIIDKVKLPQFVADWAHVISPKFSLWISDNFKKVFLLNEIQEDVIRNIVIKQMEDGNIGVALRNLIEKSMRRFEGEYQEIADWLHGRSQGIVVENDKINFKTLTLEEALRRANAWHVEVAQRAREIEQEEERARIEAEELRRAENPQDFLTDPDGEVVIAFPDGYYWLNLGASNCSKEARIMGHCGSGRGTLHSLRKNGKPFITADILPNGTVRQMRGKFNSKPKSEFYPYIKELIKSDIVTKFEYWDYRKSRNFFLKDLGIEEALRIIAEKPSLAENQGLDEYLDDNDDIVNEIVTTDFDNEGQGGIESQTKDDVMGYYHSEEGALNHTPQPGKSTPHTYFGSGGGKEQSEDQTEWSNKSGAKGQVEDGIQ